jgi:hypothetical protein
MLPSNAPVTAYLFSRYGENGSRLVSSWPW